MLIFYTEKGWYNASLLTQKHLQIYTKVDFYRNIKSYIIVKIFKVSWQTPYYNVGFSDKNTLGIFRSESNFFV